MEILVCAATSTEARACRSGVRAAGCSELIEVLQTGMGQENARNALELRLERAPRPRLVVSSGFAGACGAGIPLRSWVTAGEIVATGQASSPLRFAAYPFTDTGALLCCLASSTELLVSKEMRERVAAGLPQPAAVDMESAGLAEAAQSRGIPLLVWRTVTDTVEAPLPDFLHSYAAAMSRSVSSARMRNGLGVLAAAAIRHPWVFARLARNISISSRVLREGWERHAARIAEIARSA